MTRTQITITKALHHDEQFRKAVSLIPEQFEGGGDVIFASRNIIKRMVLPTGNGPLTVIVKCFRKPKLIQSIYYTITGKSKASKAFNNDLELLNRGINTPEPFAFINQYRFGLLCACYLITAEEPAPPIADSIPVYDEGCLDNTMAEDFGEFVATLHEKGIIHGDLNSTNVRYITRDDGHFDFTLIDTNRMKFYPLGKSIPMNECLENLTRFTGRVDIVEIVALSYARHRGIDTEKFARRAVAVKKAHDKAWKRRKRITHPFTSNV